MASSKLQKTPQLECVELGAGRRVVLLDVPSILALTVASGVLAQQLQADTLMACGMGTCAGYAGSEVLKLLLAKLPGGQIDKGHG